MTDKEDIIKAIENVKSVKKEIDKLYDISIAKSEAIKEFARKLKCGVPQETGVIHCADVDKLVKEMVGEE